MPTLGREDQLPDETEAGCETRSFRHRLETSSMPDTTPGSHQNRGPSDTMHILIADDHDLVRDAVSAFISHADPDIRITSCASLDEAWEAVEGGLSPDIAILDLNMPGMNGVEGMKRFIGAYPDILTVLMSGNAPQEMIDDAIASGARGFLPKTMNAKAFFSAISLIASGERFVPFGAPATAEPNADDTDLPSFTRREGDVLSGLISGWTNKEIARDLGLQEVTIKLHVKNICRKLSARNRTEAALKASSLGWKAIENR